MTRSFSSAFLAIPLGLLTACQPLPHPFGDEQLPPDASILAVPEVFGVVVEPIENAPPGTGPIIQQAMVQAFQDADIPADIGVSNTHSFHLGGKVTAIQPGGLTLQWTLKDAAGTTLHEDRQLIPSGKLVDDGFVRNEAQQLAAYIAKPGPVEHASTRRIYILPIKDAPGDGKISLARSIGYLLSRSGFNIAETTPGPDTIKIQGQVQIEPAPGDQQHVRIIWHVLNPAGSEIGQVSQENTVTKGSLDGAWSEIAMAVASAARDDLIGLIGRVPAPSS